MTEELDDEKLEQFLYPPKEELSNHKVDWSYVYQELKRKGVTRELLWYEYKEQNPEGLSYSRFCYLYRKWLGEIDYCMRQNYKAGEKTLIDYAGLTVPVIINVETFEIETLKTHSFKNKNCEFGYRDSIFKRKLKGKHIINYVSFQLKKQPVFKLNYGNLPVILVYQTSLYQYDSRLVIDNLLITS